MKDQDYEILSQYLDGELPAAEALTLKRRLLAEPGLRERFDNMQTVNNTIREAFTAPGSDAVPAAVAQLLDAAADTEQRQARPAWAMALAASVLVAFGAVLVQQFTSPANHPAAAPQLAEVLEHYSSSGDQWVSLADGEHVRPVLTYQVQDGSWCREYLLSRADGNWRGVACRDDSGWSTRALGLESGASSSDKYRPAGSPDADQVATFANQHAAGIALGAADEAALIARGWR